MEADDPPSPALPHYVDWHWLWLAVAAFLAGVLNAVAGGGSFLLFPAMLGMKILPVQANATNTVALWPGQLTSIAAYRDDIRKNLRLAWPMGLAGLLGGTAGARGAAEHAADDLSAPGAVAAAGGGLDLCRQRPGLALAGAQQARPRSGAAPATSRAAPPAVFLATMVVCFYIGYFGAGAGFLLITAALALRLSRPARDQRPQGGHHHAGQRHRLPDLCRRAARWSGATACWPWSPAPSAATPRPALRAAFRSPCCADWWSSSAFHGRVVLLEESVESGVGISEDGIRGQAGSAQRTCRVPTPDSD